MADQPRPPQSGPPLPDPQDPLPEPSFLWRRLLTFLSAAGFWVLLWLALGLLPRGDVLAFAQGVMLLLALVLVLYFGGASATDIGGIVANLQLRLGRRPEPPASGPGAGGGA